MSKFKITDFKVQSESKNPKEMNIVKLDQGNKPVVKDFEFNQLQRQDGGDYDLVKSKYGPLAITDRERSERAQKDRRFSLNPLLRGPLSVEQEEQRVIENKVKEQLTAITEQAKATAAQAGYKDGFKKGYEDAFKKTQIEGARSLERFDRLLIELENAKDEIFRANERFLIELMYRIARMVLLRELSTDKDHLNRLVKELINRVGVRDNITIRISPEDGETIAVLKDTLEKTFGGLNNLNVEVSTQVKQGGCRIETEWNAIETNVETQLHGIYDALIGKRVDGDS